MQGSKKGGDFNAGMADRQSNCWPTAHQAAFTALVQRIRDLIRDRNLTQAKAAGLPGLDQPNASTLVRGRRSGCSVDRLFRYLSALGQKSVITA